MRELWENNVISRNFQQKHKVLGQKHTKIISIYNLMEMGILSALLNWQCRYSTYYYAPAPRWEALNNDLLHLQLTDLTD